MESDSYQFDFSAITSPQLKESISDSFLPNRTSPDVFSFEKPSRPNRQSLVSPTNDPWKSVPKTNVTNLPDGNFPLTTSSINDTAWAQHFSTPVSPMMQQEGNSKALVTLDPWSSNAVNKSDPKPKSTNPWANDVSEVNIAQSVAPTKAAHANLQQNNALSFDPLKSDWTRDTNPSQLQDPSDLFGNWDTAVRQMHQLPSHTTPYMYGANTWSQHNQMITTGQTFSLPSLI